MTRDLVSSRAERTDRNELTRRVCPWSLAGRTTGADTREPNLILIAAFAVRSLALDIDSLGRGVCDLLGGPIASEKNKMRI